MLDTCTMDDYRKLPFFQEAASYCSACSAAQDEIMTSVITSKSDTCDHFVYRRVDMPLYWRSRWKCGCTEDIGSLHTSQTILTCSFKKHTSRDEYICYENCVSDKVCDWAEMYRYFEEELAFINLRSSVLCKNWMENWIFTIPGEQRFENMDDTFCPCLDALKNIGYGFDSILDCIPVTFHQLTMLDLYNQICYDPLMLNSRCMNSIGYIAIQLGETNYTAASSCYSAIELASSQNTLSDNLEDIMCDCFVPLYSSIKVDHHFLEAVNCVGDDFAINICDCPDYNGTECFVIGGENSGAISTHIKGLTLSTSRWKTSTSTWKTLTFLEIPLVCSFSILAYVLQRRKSRKNSISSI